MQRAQRTFGRFLKRTPNEADVEAMLSDFNDSEQMLEKVRFVVLTRRCKNIN
jgi:amphiphysin